MSTIELDNVHTSDHAELQEMWINILHTGINASGNISCHLKQEVVNYTDSVVSEDKLFENNRTDTSTYFAWKDEKTLSVAEQVVAMMWAKGAKYATLFGHPNPLQTMSSSQDRETIEKLDKIRDLDTQVHEYHESICHIHRKYNGTLHNTTSIHSVHR
jgi:hypothetical protein